jgi:hypothetical protein
MIWRDTGWRDSACPAGFAPIDIIARGGVPRDYELADSANRQFVARAGDRGARILNFGVDVLDYRMRFTISIGSRICCFPTRAAADDIVVSAAASLTRSPRCVARRSHLTRASRTRSEECLGMRAVLTPVASASKELCLIELRV